MQIVTVPPVTEDDSTITIEYDKKNDIYYVSSDLSPLMCSRQQMDKVVEEIQKFMNH